MPEKEIIFMKEDRVKHKRMLCYGTVRKLQDKFVYVDWDNSKTPGMLWATEPKDLILITPTEE